ncbi:MAG: phosphoglucomutase/phosphomannomutase family protein [Candidatus Omnitrophica bacterium]|nr:phosphoglucomutase/phosphomannomutase family protein [Candidatus Omnitrophota bacterium]
MTEIRFGTDGWRSLVAEDFTFPNVRAVTQGVASYLKKHPTAGRRKAVIVGYDTRPLGDRFAEAVAEVLAGNGFQVLLTPTPMPTPAISFAIRELKLQGGIAVTASHNPFTYNGLKFKPSYAGPAEPEMTRWIEQRLFKEKVRRIPLSEGLQAKKIVWVDLSPRYLKFLRQYVEWPVIRRAKFRVAYESMRGAGQDLLQKVLAGSRIEVIPVPHPDLLRSQHRPEPIGEHLKELSRTVRRLRCDAGLATDGDADRLGLVAPDGQFVSSQETMALLLWHLLEDRRWRGLVASTVSASNILEAITERYGVEFRRTPVGFKHIARLIRSGGVLFGGEESGGFGFRGCVPERDGLLAGLLVLEMIAMRRRNLSAILRDMRKEFGRWYFQRADLELEKPVPMERLTDWARTASSHLDQWFGRGTRVDTLDGVKIITPNRSWLLLRPSGTEPLLRVYGEAPSPAALKTLLKKGREVGRSIVES